MDDMTAISCYWAAANRQMVAKILSEFYYEGAFDIGRSDAFVNTQEYYAWVGESKYLFIGQWYIWDNIQIDPASIRRIDNGTESDTINALHLLEDLKHHLPMTDEQVAEHVEDMNATLYSDCHMMANRADYSVERLCEISLLQQQAIVNGHPKFSFNKGRRGWGINDLQAYAPEYQAQFQLMWVAVCRDTLQQGIACHLDWNEHLNSSVLSAKEWSQFHQQIHALGMDIASYVILPVHPWQWRNKVSLAFIKELSDQTLIYLGEAGAFVSSQLSIRTLSVHPSGANTTAPHYDIKLPLTIMNTSCYRGIPGRYIKAGPYASSWIKALCSNDSELRRLGTQALEEPASAYINAQCYTPLTDAPYRYHELLGVIWRESAESQLKQGEHAYVMAMLFEQDSHDNSVIVELIKRSGLAPKQWLNTLFEVVVIPYYHLLAKHGISLIAHGQNVTLICRDNIPQRILLKDFQGDMRLVQSDIPELDGLPDIVRQVTTRLPEELIIHDLQTGHFVTVLRFISPLLHHLDVSELEFYRCLSRVIRQYQHRHPDLAERFERLDLFKPKILRLGLNLSKFRHNTDKSSDRMLPDMDRYMDNPLYIAEQ